MSARYGSLPGVAAHYGHTGLGLTADEVRDATATGDQGSGLLFDDLDPSDHLQEVRALVLTTPPSGTLFVEENGSYALTTAADGTYTFTYRLYVDGVDLGTATESVVIGSVGVSAPGIAATSAVGVPSVEILFGSAVSVVGIGPTSAAGAPTVTASGGLQPPQVIYSRPWDELIRNIIMFVPDAPDFTIKNALVYEAREWYRATRSWRYVGVTLALTEAGSANYAFNAPANTEVIGLPAVSVGGGAATENVNGAKGSILVRLTSAASIEISPAPAESLLPVVATIAVGPTAASPGLPELQYQEHHVGIEAAAIYRLMSMRGKSWSNPSEAAGWKAVANRMALLASTDAGASTSQGARLRVQSL